MKKSNYGIDWIEPIFENASFKYMTTKDVEFTFDGIDTSDFTLKNTSGQTLAIARCVRKASPTRSVLTVKKGFKWDGCTGVGNIYENKYTLMASIVHDILYIAQKDSDKKLPYTLGEADILLKKQIELWQKHDGVKSCIASVYYWGIKIFGWAWKFNKVPGYIVHID